LFIGLVAASASIALAVTFPNYVFTQAGVYPGSAQTYPNGANLTQIAGYYQQPAAGTYGYIQTGKAFVTAQPAGSIDSYLFSINANGLAVGGFCPPRPPGTCGGLFAVHGYTYDYATGATVTIDYPGAGTTAAYGINDSGVVVGGFCVQGVNGCPINLTFGSSHAFMDDNGVFTQLDYPGAELTTAFGINNAGTIVGLYVTPTIAHGFLYQNGVYTDLNYPGANWTNAFGVSNAGVVVGIYQDALFRVFGFMYYNGKWAQINARSGGATGISGINDHNDLVGTWSGFNGLHPIKGVPKRTIPTSTN
jgi:probable HAF family extracellular repeat protein